MSDQPVIGVTTSASTPNEHIRPYEEAVRRAGGLPRLLTPSDTLSPTDLLRAVDGLLLTGGADVSPAYYNETPGPYTRTNERRDAFEVSLVREALDLDVPILGICRGFQLLNVVMGGKLIQDLPGHAEKADGASVYHEVFVSPGSRMTSILGCGGFMKVNSRHHQGFKLAQKASDLQASIYSLSDNLVEGVESIRHRWVVAVQCHPERAEETPVAFQGLFRSLVTAAAESDVVATKG